MAQIHNFIRFFADVFKQYFQFIFFQTNFTMLNKYLFAALALLFAGAVVAQSHSPKPLLKSPNLPTKHFRDVYKRQAVQ